MANDHQHRYTVEGMNCADCAVKVEKGVGALPGVQSAQVAFVTSVLKLEGDVDTGALRRRIELLGYRLGENEPTPVNLPALPRKKGLGQVVAFLRFLWKENETRLALLGGLLFGLGFLPGLLNLPALLVAYLENGFWLTALLVAGFPIVRSGLANLIVNRDFNINLLMSISAVGAVVIGEITEAAALIFLYAIAEALESFTTDRARSVLGELTELTPTTATRGTAGRDEVVALADLRVGDTIIVRPGERIPMDGRVAAGASDVNQAPITGESQPVEKQPGAEVFAGTVNGSGMLQIMVTRLVQDNTLSRIIQLVQEAQSVRAPAQRAIDRFARVYTPAVVILAALVAAIPPLFFNEPFLNTADGRGWLYRALALLVISCPCSLVISAPVSVLSAITAAARRGVLFKGGAFLEKMAGVRLFAFDKTGTLTRGKPVVTHCRSIECESAGECEHCNQVLGIAWSLETRSEHPLARAIVSEAEARGLHEQYLPAEQVMALAGRGLQGVIDGRTALIGSHGLFDAEYPHDPRLCQWANEAEASGHTTMLVADGTQVRGMVAVADQLRPDSPAAVEELHRLGVNTVMLTGDNAVVAEGIAARAGVQEFRAGLLPEDKVNAVRELAQRHGVVAMVGDGINDTPALAAADLGISMGGAGSAQALETADVVLMGDTLAQLPFAYRLSGFTNRLMRGNIAISLLVKAVFLLLAVSGVTSMWLAVLADTGLSLLVTANSLRPLRFR